MLELGARPHKRCCSSKQWETKMRFTRSTPYMPGAVGILALVTPILLVIGAGSAVAAHLRIPVALGASSSTPPAHVTVVQTATGRIDNGYTGTFEATTPLCSSGTWSDVETPIAADNSYTCGDASGTFAAAERNTRVTLGGGTGAYLALRGSGSCQVTSLPDGLFIRTCDYLAGLDNVSPSATITRFGVSRRSGTSSVTVRVAFVAHDDVAGNPVRFRLSVRAGTKVLGRRRGSTTGTKSVIFRSVKVPVRTHRVALTLTLADPLGNSRTVRRSVRAL